MWNFVEVMNLCEQGIGWDYVDLDNDKDDGDWRVCPLSQARNPQLSIVNYEFHLSDMTCLLHFYNVC